MYNVMWQNLIGCPKMQIESIFRDAERRRENFMGQEHILERYHKPVQLFPWHSCQNHKPHKNHIKTTNKSNLFKMLKLSRVLN